MYVWVRSCPQLDVESNEGSHFPADSGQGAFWNHRSPLQTTYSHWASVTWSGRRNKISTRNVSGGIWNSQARQLAQHQSSSPQCGTNVELPRLWGDQPDPRHHASQLWLGPTPTANVCSEERHDLAATNCKTCAASCSFFLAKKIHQSQNCASKPIVPHNVVGRRSLSSRATSTPHFQQRSSESARCCT